ncbi:unnamed protein product, partial [Scytosiphon promiscuus]
CCPAQDVLTHVIHDDEGEAQATCFLHHHGESPALCRGRWWIWGATPASSATILCAKCTWLEPGKANRHNDDDKFVLGRDRPRLRHQAARDEEGEMPRPGMPGPAERSWRLQEDDSGVQGEVNRDDNNGRKKLVSKQQHQQQFWSKEILSNGEPGSLSCTRQSLRSSCVAYAEVHRCTLAQRGQEAKAGKHSCRFRGSGPSFGEVSLVAEGSFWHVCGSITAVQESSVQM